MLCGRDSGAEPEKQKTERQAENPDVPARRLREYGESKGRAYGPGIDRGYPGRGFSIARSKQGQGTEQGGREPEHGSGEGRPPRTGDQRRRENEQNEENEG